MDEIEIKAPFPYFGGKSKVSSLIWSYLGQPAHYIEPFFGSGAVLLNRPDYNLALHTETINDKDGHCCNVWRALQNNPDEVAKYCDWPVNHADLIARKKSLIKKENWLVENLCRDDKWYDSEMAGYWIWSASCWIGSGLTRPGQIPHLGNKGRGVHAVGKIPHLSDEGRNVQEPYNINIYQWFRKLSERLRYVRVVCGDWSRVCGGDWQDRMGDVGIFFDPPYAVEHRDQDVYHHDSITVAKEVEDWCLERGKKETYRIICAGYQGEYQKLINDGWTVHNWASGGGYSNTSKKETQGKINRKLEILVISPHCLKNNLLWK